MDSILNYHNNIINNVDLIYSSYKSKYILDHIKNNKIIIDLFNINEMYFIPEDTIDLLSDEHIIQYLCDILHMDGQYYRHLNIKCIFNRFHNSVHLKKTWDYSIILNGKFIHLMQVDKDSLCTNLDCRVDIKDFIEYNIIYYNPEDYIIPSLISITDPLYNIINDLKTQISELKNEIKNNELKNENHIIDLKNKINNFQFKDISVNNNEKNKESCDMIKLNDYQ